MMYDSAEMRRSMKFRARRVEGASCFGLCTPINTLSTLRACVNGAARNEFVSYTALSVVAVGADSPSLAPTGCHDACRSTAERLRGRGP